MLALFFLGLASVAGLVDAKPVYDPFIQEFQVGTHADPDKMELIWGYPAGLLEVASVDTTWTNSALQILNQEPSLESPHLILKLLAAMKDDVAAESWLRWHRLRIENLTAWSDTLDASGRYLLAERLTMGFFRAVQAGEMKKALELAKQLSAKNPKMEIPARDRFVWDLRVRLITRILKLEHSHEGRFFESILVLGPFDTGNAWSIWTAHRRLNGLPAFPPSLNTRQEATKLAVLRKSWLVGSDIENSAFSQDVKAGLGAILLKKQELNRHLGRYPEPPGNFSLQGWWVSGQRSSRRGETSFYEALSRREDLNLGWRMDLLRRASEVHLLNGRWERGLDDLELSLNFATKKAGTTGQRRRLRQWTEQALVLALAQADTKTAHKVFDLGNDYLVGKELEAFLLETRHWQAEIGMSDPDTIAGIGLKVAAGQIVESGTAPPIEPVDPQGLEAFLTASATPLWNLWARWGLAGIPASPENAAVTSYRSLLESCGQEIEGPLQTDIVIQAVALVLSDRLDRESLLRWVLDKDIHNLSWGRALTGRSPMAGLAKNKLDDAAALHAMLGLALLADDLRGIVGVATPMNQTGLTKKEKLCFLYPLPRTGAIHQALAKADNDPALILAVARNESLFEPSVRSRAGALGWLQIMPFHFADRGALPGVDNWSCAKVSIAKGDALLKENRRRYQGNPYKTLAAYNAGPGATARWQKQLGETTRQDIFLAWIGYPETRHYVEKVLIDRMVYHWIIDESRLAN